MNYVEVQTMRKEAGSLQDMLTMHNPLSHVDYLKDQASRNGWSKVLFGRGDEGYVDYLMRTGKVDANNDSTAMKRYNVFYNGWDPAYNAIKQDYGDGLLAKTKAFFGLKPDQITRTGTRPNYLIFKKPGIWDNLKNMFS